MLLTKLLRISCIAHLVLLSVAEEEGADDDDAHSCSLLQVASSLQQLSIKPGKQTRSTSHRAAHHPPPFLAPHPAYQDTYWDCFCAWCYSMFVVYLLCGFKPTCQNMLALLRERKSDERGTLGHREGSFETSHTTAEVVITPPTMPNKAGLLDILPTEEVAQQKLAIIGADTRDSLTYKDLRAMVDDPAWEEVTKYNCVALALGPGIELATSLMCVMARTKCTPVDPNLAEDEAVFALRQFGASCIVLNPEDAPGFAAAAASLKLSTFILERSKSDNASSLKICPKVTSRDAETACTKKLQWNCPEDVVLLLRTSGTTGKSKVVPLLLRQVVQGARAIATSMKLGQEDVCLNAMPLFHIGGISCNFLAVLASGGSVVCFEKRFDPRSFAGLLTEEASTAKPTWYYATPSMHLAIADSAGSVRGHSLRIVRSGAAALTPDLQQRLEDMFGCVVMATCSMTECMPVASPVLGELDCSEGPQSRVQPLGSVGRPIGPSVEIHGGEIMLRGSLVTLGYWGADSGWKDGLFATGDLGHIDEDGFLWLTGRKKEVINQGGETIAPQELEETVISHMDVKEVAAYPVLHERLGEAVALAVCLEDKKGKFTASSELQDLAESISSILAPGRRPAVIAFVSCLSRTATGKVQRLKNPWCSQGSAQKTIISGEERQIIVLDARHLENGATASAKRVTAEPGTFLAILHQDAAAANDGGAQGEEMYDSLGMLQSVGAKENFEVRVASAMYILGMLGITVSHIGFFGMDTPWERAEYASGSTHGLWLWVVSLRGKFHLPLFFVVAGYLDTLYSPNLGARDVATYALVMLFPLGEFLQITWFGWLHPGRWFLFCLLLVRVHMAFQRRFNVPKILMLIVFVFAGNIWQYLVRWSQGVTYGIPVLHWFTLVTMRFDSGWDKVCDCMIAYAVAAMWLPDLVKKLGSKGPRTVRHERMLGLAFWALFCFINVKRASEEYQFLHSKGDAHVRSIDFVNFEVYWENGLSIGKPQRNIPQDPKWIPPFRFLIETTMAFVIPQIVILAAAIAYLPVDLPDAFMNASFGALLLLPVHAMKWFQSCTGSCLFSLDANVFVRIFAFLCFYSLYYAGLSSLLQMFVGKAMTAATMIGTRLYQRLHPIDS